MSNSTQQSDNMTILKSSAAPLSIANHDEIKEISKRVSLGEAQDVYEGILDIIKEYSPECDTTGIEKVMRDAKAKDGQLVFSDFHNKGDGTVLRLCNGLILAKTKDDIKNLFISSKWGAPKDQKIQTINTDLFVCWLNSLIIG